MAKQPIDDVLFRGVLWGLVAVLLGSLIYGLVTSPLITWEIKQIPLPYTKPKPPDSPADLIDDYLQGGIVRILGGILWLIHLSMLVGVIGFVLWAIPGAVGGAVLSILIHFVTAALPSLIRVGVSLLIGACIGALIGGASGFVFTPLLAFFGPDITLVLRFFLPPALVGAFCGALAGWWLASGYGRVKPLGKELPYFRALFRGLAWGFAASVLSSLIYGLIYRLFFRPSLFDGVFYFMFLVMPGSVFGGAILGMLLHILAVKTPLLSRYRTLTGVFSGGVLWFLITVLFAFPSAFMDMSMAIMCLVAIATGAFVGWRLALACGQ
jgi:hypothetical protein